MPNEIRSLKVSVRAVESEGGARILTGTIPFNSRSELLAEMGEIFYELIAPGAFHFAPDVRALIDHRTYPVLGRTANGKLKLTQGEAGLDIEVEIDDTQDANDLYKSVKRGDIAGVSFRFSVNGPAGETWDYSQQPPTRTLIAITIDEVSFVGQPAYTDTTVAARSLKAHADSKAKESADAIAAQLEIEKVRIEIDELAAK